MVDFKPDRELEAKEFNETFKPGKKAASPRDIYMSRPVWARNLTKIIAGIIIIIALVLIGRAIHHSLKTDSGTNTITQTSHPKVGTPLPKAPRSSGSSTGSTSGQVPNTGPGDVAGLFVGASALGAGSHYLLNRRKR